MTANHVKFVVAGTTLPILETPVKDKDHTYYAFRLPNEKASPYGIGWDALATTLPTSVTIDGQYIALQASLTPAEDKDGKPKVQRNRVSGRGTAAFPSIGEKAYSVSISETTSGLWNIKVTLNRGSATPESRQATAQAKVAANRAAMLAFLA